MNNLNIIGNISTDITLRQVNGANGATNVCDFNVAVNNRNKTATFFKATAWGKLAESIAQYSAKGQKIFVSGPVALSEYNGHAKMAITVENVEFLSPRQGATATVDAPAARAAVEPDYNATVPQNNGVTVRPDGFVDVSGVAKDLLPF